MKKEDNEKCLSKILEMRKELGNTIRRPLTRENIDKNVINAIRALLVKYHLMVDHTVVDFRSELITIPYGITEIGIPKQRITMTVAYSVVDVDSCNTVGPLYVSTITIDALNNNDNAQELNEWQGLLAIFYNNEVTKR